MIEVADYGIYDILKDQSLAFDFVNMEEVSR
jgi:hypothetical protein